MAKDTAPPPEDDSKTSSPSEDGATSPPPPPSSNDTSTSPPPSSSPPPPPASPPPKSSPSPPPPKEKSPPPPKEEKSPPPPSPDDSSASPPPEASTASPPPPPPPSTNSSSTSPSPVSASPPPPVGNSTSSSSSSSSSPPPPPVASRKTPPSSTPSVSPPPPPTSSSSSSSSSSPSSSSSSGNTGIIIGAAIAGVVIFAVIVIWLTCCSRKKKKQQYYMEPPRGPQGDYYNGSVKWNNPLLSADQAAKLPPPPGGGWGGPPPPPQGNISGDYSSGFSGPHHGPMPPQTPNMGLGSYQSDFTYEELAAATNGFSAANILGQGGFGYVHKGVLLSGKEVAVKSLKSGSGQGEREFQAEVEIISRVHHRHLVSLVGYCIANGQRMLVYEFVPNKTLEFHLHGKGQPVMDWATRMRIALGSAKGLAYLHEDCHPKIIHRDIKAANILLDFNFEAMVADFGLAKLSSDNYTHVSTRVMGTFGYLAPEYASSGKLSDKSDVFSFGVMLLELITGRRPVDPTNQYMEDSLVDWARPLLGQALQDGNYDELADPRLENNYVPHEMALMVACAAAGIRHSARRRAKMSQIVRALEGDASLDDLVNEGVKTNQSASNSNNSSSDTRAYDTGAYNADMMKFKQMVMSGDRDVESSEYGATSEYGLNPSISSGDSTELGQSGTQKRKP